MDDSSSFIETLVKQTCRRAAYDFQLSETDSNEENEGSIYSKKFLKLLYENPKDNVTKLFRTSEGLLNPDELPEHHIFKLLNDANFQRNEKREFLRYIIKVKENESAKEREWSQLRHFMHYCYRNFASVNPNANVDTLPDCFIREMRELVVSLYNEDEGQLLVKLYGLIRGYCIFAYVNFSSISENETHKVAAATLVSYYDALLKAADKVTVVFSEFEILLYKNYSVSWTDFNTFIFLYFFYETSEIQNRLTDFKRYSAGHNSIKIFNLLAEFKSILLKHLNRVRAMNAETLKSLLPDAITAEEATISNYKQLLRVDFWIDRTQAEKDSENNERLDHHVFRIVGDKTIEYPEQIFDENGSCLCEECLVTIYKCLIDSSLVLSAYNQRLVSCHRCHYNKLICLDYFLTHLEGHHRDTDKICNGVHSTIEENDDPYTPGQSPLNLSFLESLDHSDSYENSKNSSPVFNLLYSKALFEEIQKLQNSPTDETEAIESLKNKHIKNFIQIKKDIFDHPCGSFGGKVYDNAFKDDEITEEVVLEEEEEHDEEEEEKCEMVEDKEAVEDRELHNHSDETVKMDFTNEASCEEQQQHHHQKDSPMCEHNCSNKADNHGDSKTSDIKRPSCKSTGRVSSREKKCDCTYCEVFGASVTAHPPHNSELRDRLRNRLHQRREKRTKDASTCESKSKAKPKEEPRVPMPADIVLRNILGMDTTPCVEENSDDIQGIMNFIEGGVKVVESEKKAAKKARQRMKKEEERLKLEQEAKRKEREARRLEEERIKQEELAKQLEEKLRIKATKKKTKKENKREKEREKVKEKSKVVEEIIPAMVTIKRVVEYGNAPTVTITLKGSTPDQDKLLYSLVQGVKESEANTPAESVAPTKKKKKKSEDNNNKSAKNNNILTKELKVTLAVDTNNTNEAPTKKQRKQLEKAAAKLKAQEAELNNDKLNLPMLRLPPGITITKVEGPVSNRNYKTSNLQDQAQGSTINVSKTGVIVVDTEKLIQQTDSAGKKESKKSRKKKKAAVSTTTSSVKSTTNGNQMVTLKNPIFQNTASLTPIVDQRTDGCAPAAIFTSENGMVTIRSSRLQQSLSNGGGPLVSDLKPLIGSDVPSSFIPTYDMIEKKMSAFNAQEILSGLPGIEITKVDKRKSEMEACNKMALQQQTAQVSIIPSINDDWTFDSVFTPKDILEDDMDAEERELEAFKRFCQQSVPPKQKQKVDHLNVKDIVLKKKKGDGNVQNHNKD